MPLNLVSSGGGNAFIRYSIEDDEWLKSSQEGVMLKIEDDELANPMHVDIQNIKMGWLKLQGGRDWVEWEDNNPATTPKPSDAHKQGFTLMFYSKKVFVDEDGSGDALRELCTSQVGMLEFAKTLYNDLEDQFKANAGKSAVIKITGTEKVAIGKGKSKIPQFEFLKWADSPFDNEQATETAPVVSAAKEDVVVAKASSDDVNFDEI
tara:strand:+ start:12535 stop:13155 length:621 start_codon:yes stop_codon:yes gene_type:complete